MSNGDVYFECPICNETVEGAEDFAEHILELHRVFFVFNPELFVNLPMDIHQMVEELINTGRD